MVDKKPKLTDDEVAQALGYPNAEVRRLSNELVNLGWALKAGDESVRGAYDKALNKALNKGWTPDMLDGEQELFVGEELYQQMYDKYEAHVKQQA
jgi:hypothetical protein